MKSGPSAPDPEVLRAWEEWSEKRADSFFQTAEWASLLVGHYPQYALAPIVSEGFFIPLIRHRRWGGVTDSLYGMPMMTRGGVLGRKPLDSEDWREVYDFLSQTGVGTLVISFPPGVQIEKPAAGFQLLHGSTHLLSLKAGWDAILSGFERRGRNAYRRAIKEGVEIVRDESDTGVAEHWRLVSASFDRWKPDPTITYDFTKDAIQCEAGRLYLARQKGKTLGSVLTFVHGREMVLWQGSRIAEGYPRGTDNLLYGRAIQDGCEEGIGSVDFGASLGDPGIVMFKNSFGANEVEYSILKRTHPAVRLLRKLR